jgi:adenine-specific DNA-methyltransferase
MTTAPTINKKYGSDAGIVLFPGDCMDLLRTIPDDALQLVVTSPPYNLGKEYERRPKLNGGPEWQCAVSCDVAEACCAESYQDNFLR